MLGLKRHTVRVVPHDPAWADAAAAECARLRAAGGDLLLDVQHVGSTAVPGLPSKPILDFAAAIADPDALPALIERVAAAGYRYAGDGKEMGGQLFVKETAPDLRVAHLHVVAPDDPQWRNYLAFRDALRADAALRARYAHLKESLATVFPEKRRAYTAAKQDFVDRALGLAADADGADAAGMYDRIAELYPFVYADWGASVARQARDLDAFVTRALGPGPHRILDVSCGIGTQALGLAALGHRVTGSDVSAAAVARARTEAAARRLDIAFAVADMREAHARHGGGFDVVLSADNSVPHLPDDAAAAAAFASFLAALRPGGLVALSVRDHAPEGRTGFELAPYGIREVDGGRVTVFQIREHDGAAYDVSMYFVEERGDAWPRVTFGRSRYRAVPADHWLRLLAAAGFVGARRLDEAFFQPLLLAKRPGGATSPGR